MAPIFLHPAKMNVLLCVLALSVSVLCQHSHMLKERLCSHLCFLDKGCKKDYFRLSFFLSLGVRLKVREHWKVGIQFSSPSYLLLFCIFFHSFQFLKIISLTDKNDKVGKGTARSSITALSCSNSFCTSR